MEQSSSADEVRTITRDRSDLHRLLRDTESDPGLEFTSRRRPAEGSGWKRKKVILHSVTNPIKRKSNVTEFTGARQRLESCTLTLASSPGSSLTPEPSPSLKRV